jgi:hypothetical protein
MDPMPARARSSRSRLERVLARVFVVLVLAVATFAVAELISRIVSERRSHVGFATDRVPRPYTVFGPGRVDGLVRTNPLGYRGPLPAMPKGDELRVFVLGGSTVFLGKPAIPELLEQQLHEHGYGRARVFNWGTVAASSGMELARLAFEIGDYAPDLVVMYDGGNDISTPFIYDPRPGYPLNFVVTEKNPLFAGDLGVYPTWTLFAYGSNLARTFFPDAFSERLLRLAELRERVGYGSDAWQEEIVRIYLGNLVKAAKIARGYGAEFMAFFQPLIHFKGSLSAEELQVKNLLLDFLTERRAGDFEAHAQAMRARVRAGIVELGGEPPIVDLSGIFADAQGWIFTDFIHVTRAGNEAIAAAIYQSLAADPEIRALFDARGPGSPAASAGADVSGAAARAAP